MKTEKTLATEVADTEKEHQLTQEIIQITAELKTSFPELYRDMDETPLPVGGLPESKVSIPDLENYLNTLKKQLQNHIKTHEQKDLNHSLRSAT